MNNPYVNDFSTTVVTYYNELTKCKPISRAKEKELLRKAKKGDEAARNELMTANLRFVFEIAKRYKGKGASIDDLISEGNMALIKAIEKFKPSRDVKFISYAVWWIRFSMKDFIRRKQLSSNVEKGEDSLNKMIPDIEIVDDEYDDSYDIKNIDSISHSSQAEKDDENEKKEIVNKLLSKLTEREAFIIRKYYGVNGCEEKNLEEIGQELGLTKERVRQIKKQIIKKLRGEILLIEGADFMF